MADASQGGARLLLIDLSGIYWSRWHATADQSVSEAFERTVAEVHALRDKADLIAVCVDMAPYWRREILPEYKAHRAAAPPLAVEQFARVKDRLRADGFLLWGAQGFEADDVIAWAVEQALNDDSIEGIAIASADKDLHQLVSDGVRCYSPATREVIGPEQVHEKHGVEPCRMLDYLALVGDSSDNVPGVPGVGPKTAAALLNTFLSLEAVLAEAQLPEGQSRITKPKLKAALIEHADAARLARRVITLRTDVPLKWEDLRMERKPEAIAVVNAENMDADPVEPEPAPKSEPPPPMPEAKPANGNGHANGNSKSAIVRVPEEWSLALEPRSQRGAWEAAGLLFESRMYQNFGSQAAIYAVLLRGRALGMDATTSLAVFHNIKGKLSMHADLIEALVIRSGKAEYFEFVESSSKVATYATKRVGSRREQTLTFTIEDALAAGLVKKDPAGRDGYLGISESGQPSNWDKYRALMLRHRCKTQLARAVYSDVVLGLYMPEELGEQSYIDMEATAA